MITFRFLLKGALALCVALAQAAFAKPFYYQVSTVHTPAGVHVQVGLHNLGTLEGLEGAVVLANGVPLALQSGSAYFQEAGDPIVFSAVIEDTVDPIALQVSIDALGIYDERRVGAEAVHAMANLFPSDGVVKTGEIDGKVHTYAEQVVSGVKAGSPESFRFFMKPGGALKARISHLDTAGKITDTYEISVKNDSTLESRTFRIFAPDGGGAFPNTAAGGKIVLWLYNNHTSGICNLVKYP